MPQLAKGWHRWRCFAPAEWVHRIAETSCHQTAAPPACRPEERRDGPRRRWRWNRPCQPDRRAFPHWRENLREGAIHRWVRREWLDRENARHREGIGESGAILLRP